MIINVYMGSILFIIIIISYTDTCSMYVQLLYHGKTVLGVMLSLVLRATTTNTILGTVSTYAVSP